MDKKSQKLLESLRNKKVGVFVDDSNLYHSYKKYGWRVDFKKFRDFLEKKFNNLQFINYYVVVPDKSDSSHSGTQKFLETFKVTFHKHITSFMKK